MDCLVGYGSDDENESERYGSQQPLVSFGVLDKYFCFIIAYVYVKTVSYVY